jgi:glucose/arabinose dehydrogenase
MTRLLTLLFVAALAIPAPAQTIALQPVAEIPLPVAITHARDTRLFLVDQNGRILIWDRTTVLPAPFLDIRSLVLAGGERGLLGLAFHPRYNENGFFYVNYTDRAGNGDTIVARYTRSATDPNRADPASARVLLRIDQPFANHNGGQLAFGPDGYLYIGTGDGGSANDPNNRAQNRLDLLGKILRIDVDRGDPYGIPPDNPFSGFSSARNEIWAYGLRNPWRFSFDLVTGDLWIADVGQGDLEEIDYQPASSDGGENYGWRLMEGSNCFNPPGTNCNANGALVEPVIEYDHSGGACSVTGGYVYRGAAYPRLSGLYIYGDYCNGVIWGATRLPSGDFTSRVLLDTGLFISTFGEDANGELYVADHQRGIVYRIVETTPNGPRRRSVRQ